MVRVVSIIHSSAYGGPHNQAVLLSQEARRRHVHLDLFVVLPNEAGDAASRLSNVGVECVELPLHRPRASLRHQNFFALAAVMPEQVRQIRHIIRELRADVVEIHGLLSIDAAVAAKREGVALVWQLIDTRPPKVLRRILMPYLRHVSDVVMTTGRAVGCEYGLGRRGSTRWISFLPAVDQLAAGHAQSRRAITRQKLNLTDTDLALVSLGNYNPQKGHLRIIEAAVYLRQRGVNAHVRIRGSVQVGHEEYFNDLCASAKLAGMPSDSVDVLEDMTALEFIAAGDVFVLPATARSEGVSTVVLEAMSVEVPVVVSAVGGLAEATGGKRGWLLTADNQFELNQVLSDVLNDPADRGQRARSAKTWVMSNCTPLDLLDSHLDAYRLAVRSKAQ